MAAQNQHYVPKFILRQFLSKPASEQVSVYDKRLDKTFNTSIKNIMAERRFNDFSFEEWNVSYEPVACRIEDKILPTYQKIINRRQLDGTEEEREALSVLVAFQLLRARACRDVLKSIDDQLRAKVVGLGHEIEHVEGWGPQTEDGLKKNHLIAMQKGIQEYAGIISKKVFFLASSKEKRRFYLGDNPVCLHNDRDFGPYGSLGIGVPGIQIFLPLASDLMLCVFCRSIVNEMMQKWTVHKQKMNSELSVLYISGIISEAEFKLRAEILNELMKSNELYDAIQSGFPMNSSEDNMKFYNALQIRWATRYIICRNSDFGLARSYTKKFPETRNAPSLKFG